MIISKLRDDARRTDSMQMTSRSLTPFRVRLSAVGAVGAFVGTLYVLAILSTAFLGMTWSPPASIIGLIPISFLGLALIYRMARPSEVKLFEVIFYSAIFGLLSLAGVHLSYVANTLNFPLQNSTFTQIDHLLGFDWAYWADFVTSRPLLFAITTRAYESHAWQPFLAIIIVTFFGPRHRNADFLLANTIALTTTIAVSAIIPAIEPGAAYGYDPPAAKEMMTLRAGQWGELGYVGIICFPSFHSAMAVVFTTVYRGIPVVLIPAAVVNGLMLLSVPFSGDHYLVDLLGGVLVALFSQYLATRLLINILATNTGNWQSPARDAGS